MYRAVCVRKCVFGGRVWRAGEEYSGEDAPPRHFVPPVPEPVPEPPAKKKTK
ncbi:MAG: hypothetical protein LBL73_00175 [Synergistaceae bacterium]|nr:hypothetical protein [Synergistaceae bacterium]